VQKETRSNAGFGPALETVMVIGLGMLCLVAFLWDTMLVRFMVSLQMNDFGRFYYSARAFLSAQDMYAPSVATPLGAGVLPDSQQLLNLNPPHFHLVLLPLARLEPNVAVSLWMIASLFAFVLSILLIGRELEFVPTPRRVLSIVLFMLACSASQAVLITGQLAFLLMLPLTLCWRDARNGRWTRAGLWLGPLLSVKPFFLILVPCLIRHRQWRACLLTATTMAACFLAGVVVFGLPNYMSWGRALSQSADWAWLGMNASLLGAFQRVFSASPSFEPLAVAPTLVCGWIPVAGVLGFATVVVPFVDNTTIATDRAFALLLISAQLLSPVGWVYYLWFAAGPIAALLSRHIDIRRVFSGSGFLAVVGLAGLLTPITSPYFFQPARWATLTLGSVYFWSAIAIWGCLMLNFAHDRINLPIDRSPAP
jgi:hypothetical protein